MSEAKVVFPQHAVRMRRLRQHPGLRDLVRETQVQASDLVLPLFIKAGKGIAAPIKSLPGHYHWSVDQLLQPLTEFVQLGLSAVILFGLPAYKDDVGSCAWQDDGVVQQAVRLIKQHFPQLVCMVDCCFCEYTTQGHCGVLSPPCHDGIVDNDATLPLLAKQAVSLAQAGADVIAPSGMMDGMVAAIRQGLDFAGYQQVPILSYAVKYASCFYDPFREAAEGAPQQGDRRGYQMDPANAARALREAQLDVEEGADCLMVKPAGAYLDVIYRVKQAYPAIPLAAYQVSGEYAMIHAAANAGVVDLSAAMHESLLAIKRAGADFIISYFTPVMLKR